MTTPPPACVFGAGGGWFSFEPVKYDFIGKAKY